MRQHRKIKDKDSLEKIRMMNAVADRTPMPRPTVFRDKSKYDRRSYKKNMRQALAEA